MNNPYIGHDGRLFGRKGNGEGLEFTASAGRCAEHGFPIHIEIINGDDTYAL